MRPSRFSFGPFCLDPDAGLLTRNGDVVRLRRKTWQVLCLLVANAGRVVLKEEILDAVWENRVVSDTAVGVTIAELRRALDDAAGGRTYIETLYGRGYRFVGEHAEVATTRDDPGIGEPARVPPPLLVGREAELALSREFLVNRQAAARVLLIAGDAGIGKTALMEAILAEVRQTMPVGLGQCPPQLGTAYPYLPVLGALHEICSANDSMLQRLARLAPGWFARLPGRHASASAASCPEGAAPGGELEPAELVAFLEGLAPVMLAIEDLHWADHATVDLISLLSEHPSLEGCRILATYRPAEAIAEKHPIVRTRAELLRRQRARELALEGLAPASVGIVTASQLGATSCPDAIAIQLHERSGGNPLYLQNLVEHLADAAALILDDDGSLSTTTEFAAAAREIPQTLRELVGLRLAELGDDELEVLGAMSVVGLEASGADVAAALDASVAAVDATCARLARRGLFLERTGETASPDGIVSGSYEFRHPLYQHVVYDDLAPAVRVEAHRRMARWLAAADDTGRAGAIALHLDRGHLRDEAIRSYLVAAESASQQHATADAIVHLRRALELQEGSEDSEREQLILTRLGIALGAGQGFAGPDFAATFARARSLHTPEGDLDRGAEAIAGLAAANLMTGAPRAAEDLAAELIEIGRTRKHALALYVGELMLAGIHYHQGNLTGVFEQIGEKPLAVRGEHIYGPIDLSIARGAVRAVASWQAGRPDDALEQARLLGKLAAEDGQPINRIVALQAEAVVDLWRGDPASALSGAKALEETATELGLGQVLGFALAIQAAATHELAGDGDPVALIDASRAASDAHGEMMTRLVSRVLGIEVLAARGHLARADEIVIELGKDLRRGEARFWEPELERWRGELLLLHRGHDAHEEAVRHFLHARDVAVQQGSYALVLRTASSLGRLYRATGRTREGRALVRQALASIVGGHDTRDVREAQAILRD